MQQWKNVKKLAGQLVLMNLSIVFRMDTIHGLNVVERMYPVAKSSAFVLPEHY